MTKSVDFSVLMPVHVGTKAEHFKESLESVLDQSQQAREIVVIEDGRLTPEHEDVLAATEMRAAHLSRLRLDRSQGIAHALQAGLEHASSEWIARMDADDIADPDRFLVQSELAGTGKYDVIGSAMSEFENSTETSLGIRLMPLAHGHIADRMRRSNPMNHPTVFFRRSLARDVGGYQPLLGLEDYDLWARMLIAGARFRNLREPLVAYRVSDAMFNRRRGWALVKADLRLQGNLVRYGLIGWPRAAFNALTRSAFRLLPRRLMGIAYRALFRTPPAQPGP